MFRNVVCCAKVKSLLPRKFSLWLARLTLAAALAAPFAAVRAGGLPREKGAIYLEDFFPRAYHLRVLTDAPIYFNADQARFLGTLRRGELVELQAVSDTQGVLRVRGQASQGQVAGWVPARYLSPLDATFVDGLRRSVERRKQVQALVAANEVALNMTPEEVTASLGQPGKKTSHADAQGVAETWDYIRYEQVARQVAGVDAFGRSVVSIVYERVPVGRFGVVFTDGLVSAIDQSERDASAATATVKTVPPPVRFANDES